MPKDKQDVVRQLQAEGHVVAVVGDGTNDALALALAGIGIAMGVSGTDVAVETADVALASDDLRALLDLRELGRRAIRCIQQNYGMSIAVNTAGLAVSAGGALSPVLPRSSTTPRPWPSWETAPAPSTTASPLGVRLSMRSETAVRSVGNSLPSGPWFYLSGTAAAPSAFIEIDCHYRIFWRRDRPARQRSVRVHPRA